MENYVSFKAYGMENFGDVFIDALTTSLSHEEFSLVSNMYF